MQHQPRPSPRELWNSAPWYERLGMTLLLGLHVLAGARILINLIFST